MKTVIVGSQNPVKLQTTKEAFERVFSEESFVFEAHEATSGVPDQPMGSEQTKEGATNRAQACMQAYPDADYYVGLEGGLEQVGEELWAVAWMCVYDAQGTCGFGRTGSFLLPHKIAALIAEGEELGTACDIVFEETNSKHKGGAVGLLTNEAVSRVELYREAIIYALIPFVQPELY